MSTRSWIGYVTEDGRVHFSYCHSDGYIGHNGMCLLLNYTHIDEVRLMVDGGNMSSLARSLRDIPYYSSGTNDAAEAPTEDDFIKYFNEDSTIEFAYLFKGGEWYVLCDWVDEAVGKKANHFFFETDRIDVPLGERFPSRLVKLTDAVAAYVKYEVYERLVGTMFAPEKDALKALVQREVQPDPNDFTECYLWEYGEEFKDFDPGTDPRDERIRQLTSDKNYNVGQDDLLI